MARKLPAGVTVRTLDDGTDRYDVRYRLPNGTQRKRSFKGITAAKEFLATTQVDKSRGGLIDPQRSRITIAAYGTEWIDNRADLAPTTIQLYRGLLRLHIVPGLGKVALGNVDIELVRRWRNDLIRAGVGKTTVAKAYRLVRAILNTAVEDGRILSNPCRIRNAGIEYPAEREVVGPAEILALAAEVPIERSCMVLLAGLCGLRLGEVLGLAVRHIDLLHGTIKVERQLQEIAPRNTQVLREPKSDASRRTLPLPAPVAAALRAHIEAMENPGPDSFLFTGERGGPLRRHVWHAQWKAARQKLGHPTLAFHDLRHSALTIYSGAGASLAELKAQGGHSTVDAALRYQHATHDRAVALAAVVDDMINADSSEVLPAIQTLTARQGVS
jgi:integrase